MVKEREKTTMPVRMQVVAITEVRNTGGRGLGRREKMSSVLGRQSLRSLKDNQMVTRS